MFYSYEERRGRAGCKRGGHKSQSVKRTADGLGLNVHVSTNERRALCLTLTHLLSDSRGQQALVHIEQRTFGSLY